MKAVDIRPGMHVLWPTDEVHEVHHVDIWPRAVDICFKRHSPSEKCSFVFDFEHDRELPTVPPRPVVRTTWSKEQQKWIVNITEVVR